MPTESPAIKPANEAMSSMAAQLTKFFPDGVIPDGGKSPIDASTAATGATGAAPEATGATGATPEATGATGAAPGATGATGAAPGATGATGAAPGATGATGAAPEATGATGAAPEATGATGATDAQLDAVEKGMDLKAGTAFRIVREREKAALKEVEDLKAELAKREAASATNTPEANKQIEEMKGILADYEKVLAVKSIEDTADFRKNIAEPLSKVEKGLEGLAAKHSITLDDLQSALADPDPAKRSDRLSELSSNFNRFDMNQFDRLILEVDRLREAKQTAVAQAAENWKTELAVQQQRAEKAKADFEADWRRALDASFVKLQDTLPILKKGEDAELNAKVDSIKTKVVATDIAKMPNDDLVAALYRSEILDIFLAQNAELTEKALSQAEQLSKLRGATPGAGEGGKPSAGGATGPKTYKSAEEAFRATLPGVLPGGFAS